MDKFDFPPVPEGAVFKPLGTKRMPDHHMYCITPKHLMADEMYITPESIARAERMNGAKCDICVQLVREGKQSEILSYAEHTSTVVAMIQIPKLDEKLKSLNQIDGLHEWLLENQEFFKAAGIGGFGFPNEDQLDDENKQ